MAGGKEVDFEGTERCRQSGSIAESLRSRTGGCLAKNIIFVFYAYEYRII